MDQLASKSIIVQATEGAAYRFLRLSHSIPLLASSLADLDHAHVLKVAIPNALLEELGVRAARPLDKSVVVKKSRLLVREVGQSPARVVGVFDLERSVGFDPLLARSRVGLSVGLCLSCEFLHNNISNRAVKKGTCRTYLLLFSSDRTGQCDSPAEHVRHAFIRPSF